MARIKPQKLLLQSKKKKDPTRISITTIIMCSLVFVLVLLSLVSTYRHWYQRSRNPAETGLSHLEDSDSFSGEKKSGVSSYATLNTSLGSITMELFKEASPQIVEKFLYLCHKGHFKGMPFRRVIKNYMIQAGEKLAAAEEWMLKVKPHNQIVTSPKHEAFMLGTSKSKQDGRSFELFITTTPIPDLSSKLIVFGQVIDGEDIVQEIEEVDTDQHYRPKSPIRIIDITPKQER